MSERFLPRTLLAAALAILLASASPALAKTVFEGIVKPAQEVDLAFPIDGPVSKVYVKEGAEVRTKAKLLKLDDALQKLEVDRRKAIFEDNSAPDSDRKSIAILQPLLESTRALYQKTASVSLDELQKLELQYQTMVGRLNESKAEKAKQRIEYEISKEMLARYTLVSPIDGIVENIRREEGEWARAGETIATIVNKKTCYVEFDIDEKDAHRLKKGDRATVLLGADGSVKAAGVVSYVSPVADSASALVKVKVEFQNPAGGIIPGVLAKIEFD